MSDIGHRAELRNARRAKDQAEYRASVAEESLKAALTRAETAERERDEARSLLNRMTDGRDVLDRALASERAAHAETKREQDELRDRRDAMEEAWSTAIMAQHEETRRALKEAQGVIEEIDEIEDAWFNETLADKSKWTNVGAHTIAEARRRIADRAAKETP